MWRVDYSHVLRGFEISNLVFLLCQFDQFLFSIILCQILYDYRWRNIFDILEVKLVQKI